MKYFNANLHVHTPYSFSFFNSVSSLVEEAKKEGINVLGINDFYTTEGFNEFTNECLKRNIYPVYGLEVMAIEEKDKEKGVLWNDPNNPGRIYLCGKGLKYPSEMDNEVKKIIDRVKKFSQKRIMKMIERVNEFFSKKIPFYISYEELKGKTPSGWVRERHLAKEIEEKLLSTKEGKNYLEKEFQNSNFPSEDIRTKFLKAGGECFVEEDALSFVRWEESMKIFLSLGGIPAYPVFADGGKVLTHMEKNPEKLGEILRKKGFFAVEFIPPRNSMNVLRKYVKTLREMGFIVSAGTEHNSLKGGSLILNSRDSENLDEEILEIFLEGCCVIAGHQYLMKKGEEGFVNREGERTSVSIKDLKEIGKREINYFIRK